MTDPTQPTTFPDLFQALINSDPRIRPAIEDFQRDGKVPVATVEPIIGDMALNAIRHIDGLDGRQDNIVTRAAVSRVLEQAIGSVAVDARTHPDQARALAERNQQMRAYVASLPENIRLHPERVNSVVSGALRTADRNDDWQLTGSEFSETMRLIATDVGRLIDAPLPTGANGGTTRRRS